MQEKIPRILVVDDEDRIRRLLRMYLEKENFIVYEADNGKKAMELAEKEKFDLIILDIMLPDRDGISICKQLRQNNSLPIIILSAKGEELTRVHGFEVGADDYIVKPFSPRELIYRVKAILRRTVYIGEHDINNNVHSIVSLGDLEIDYDARNVKVSNVEVDLTPKEFDLLYFLAKNPNKVFSREDLLRDVWNYEYFGDLRTVDTHVKRLREKLNKVSVNAASMITTIWGVGYKIEV